MYGRRNILEFNITTLAFHAGTTTTIRRFGSGPWTANTYKPNAQAWEKRNIDEIKPWLMWPGPTKGGAMAAMTEITCKCGCGRKKMVRVADRNRGWGLYFSKSCKAKKQERDTGQCRAYLSGHGVSHAAKRKGKDPRLAVKNYVKKDYEEDFDPSWDSHKDFF